MGCGNYRDLVRQELMYMDVARHAEHLGDFTYRIAEGLLNPQEEG